MSKFFSIRDLNAGEPVQEDKSSIRSLKFRELHDHKMANLKDLMDRLPCDDEAYFLWTVNSFNAFTFIPYLLGASGNFTELIISTYSINIRIIDALSDYMIKKMIRSVYILISDSAKFRIPRVVDHLEQFGLSNPGSVTIRYAWNHSKVTLIRSGDHHFVIEGSGNFSENSRHEQYVLLNSRHIYEFRRKWIIHEIHGRTN